MLRNKIEYRHLFFDLDHTLWDFDANAKLTLQELYETEKLKEEGVEDFELFYHNYLKHNQMLWGRYRRGLIHQSELRVKRMRLTLLDFKIGNDPLAETLSKKFLQILPSRNLLLPYAMEILDYLRNKNYILHLITNGFEEVQHQKIHNSKIRHYFNVVVTSEASNSLKPHKAIFDYALDAARADKPESIMLGDDLDTDIIGASEAGLDQVYINHNKKTHDFAPTFEVFDLKELETIF